MLQLLQIFILVSPAAVCLVWLAESGRLRRAFRETFRLLRALPPDRAAVLAALALWATISGGGKQMSAPPPSAPEWPADAGMQPGGDPEAPPLAEPEGGGFPWGMPLWPFDAVVSNAVAGMFATNVPPIPDAMLASGLALYRAATNAALEARATNAVPAYAWELCAADNRGLEFAMPFVFPLGTNAYGRAGVLSNGRLSFGFHTLHRRTPDGLPFATPYPVATLAPLWGPYGLLPSAGSGMWTQGDTNCFTVCWQGMLLLGDTNLPAIAQCDLLPDGAVRFRYGRIPDGAATNSTVGVQNLGPGWVFADGPAAPVYAGLELSLRPVAAAGWADADPDGDGLTNFEEFMIGTDEHLADTDGDGPSDSWEPAHGFDPLTPQLPDPDPDTDGDGIPDRWAGWMGDQLGDATNYYTLASLCTDADADGFSGWYEMFALGSNPNQAASPGAAPEGFVDMVAVVTSSLPCVLRLTGEAGSAEIPWMPGLSPERVRLRLEVGKVFQTELSRVPSGTAFPTNGFWWAGLVSFEVPDFENQPPVVMEGVTIYWGGKVRVTTPDRAGDLWQTPGEAEAPPASVEVWTINLDGPHIFCHSSGYAEVTVLSNSLYSGGLVWSSVPEGIEGEVNPLVIDPGEIPPGSYTVYAVSEENPAVTGETTVVISHLGLTETTVYIAYGDTNLTSIGISGDTYPQAGITVTSDPPGISNLSFRASDLEPGTYTVTVGNGSCETREVAITVIRVDIWRHEANITWTTNDVNVGERIELQAVVQPAGLDLIGTWEISGSDANPSKVIASYTQSVDSATIDYDYTIFGADTAFYWIDSLDNAVVTYTLYDNTLSNVSVGSAYFTVHKPVSVFGSVLTSASPPVGVREDGWGVSLGTYLEYGSTWANYGITWTNSVTTWAQGGGDLQLVQLIDCSFSATGSTHRFEFTTSGLTLDDHGGVDVADTIRSIADNATGSLQAYISGIGWVDLSDTPSQHLGLLDDLLEEVTGVADADACTFSRQDAFTSYLMYRPACERSVWVTLSRMTWYWKGSATTNGGAWVLVSGSGESPALAPSGVDSYELPVWSSYFHKMVETNTTATPLYP